MIWAVHIAFCTTFLSRGAATPYIKELSDADLAAP